MTENETPLRKPHDSSAPTAENEALYVYCLGDGAMDAIFGEIGIDGNTVFTIQHRDVAAVVHRCLPELYRSDDDEKVKQWVMTHHSVIDAAWEKFGTVLPVGFDTMIKSSDGLTAEANLRKWLEEDYEKIRQDLSRVRGKAEVGVQIFWDGKVIAQRLMDTSAEIRRLSEEMKGKPPGMAYFYKQKIERALRNGLEEKTDEYFRDFYRRIEIHTENIRIEKTKRTDGDKQMIMNLSVLIERDKIRMLGEELAKIKEIEGIDVRFTGPWPPYSFVTHA